jgi:hypothetical protein
VHKLLKSFIFFKSVHAKAVSDTLLPGKLTFYGTVFNWWEGPKERDHSKDQGVGGME